MAEIGQSFNPIQIPPQGMEKDPWAYSANPGKIDANKIANLEVDTITVSEGGYVRSGKEDFEDTTKGWYLGSEGIYFGDDSDATKLKFTIDDGSIDFIGTISGKETSDIAAAFGTGANAQNITSDLVNAQFNTSTKTILGDFTFGASGAIKMNTDNNNGLWISPTGILGKKAGVTTFAVDTSGNASFRGDVVITGGSGYDNLTDTPTLGDLAAKNTVGTSDVDTTIISGGKIVTGLLTADNIQAGTLTGRTVQTSSSPNTGVKLGTVGTDTGITVYGNTVYYRDTSGNLRGYMGSSSTQFYMISGTSNIKVKIGSSNDIVLDAAAAFSVAPARTGVDLGNSSYYWRNTHSAKYTFDNTSYYLDRNGNNLRFNGLNRIQIDGGTFRRVGITVKDSVGDNVYLEVLATDDPV